MLREFKDIHPQENSEKGEKHGYHKNPKSQTKIDKREKYRISLTEMYHRPRLINVRNIESP
jgi:hypothetical protein